MTRFLLIFLLPAVLFYTPAMAKGHGGGHGGHGGGHRGGGASHPAAKGGAGGRPAAKTTTYRVPGRSNQIGIVRNTPRTVVPGRAPVVVAPGNGYVPGEHLNYFPYGYYTYPGYYPYYDPYFGIWSFGANFMYTPHYYGNNPYNSPNNTQDDVVEPAAGFVVYEHDTISGNVTLKNNVVSLHAQDSARAYDYTFRTKKRGLQYVTVYGNTDSSNQLNLQRLSGNKKLMRVLHVGKLNIYDERYGFLYAPEDVDITSLTVVYNGQEDALNSSSKPKTKVWLTDWVNKVYGLELNPKDFTWRELLLYVDKLD